MNISDNDIASLYPKMFMKLNALFSVVDEAIVDSEKWYTVGTLNRDVAGWLRAHSPEVCVERSTDWGVTSYFDIHEKLYTMLGLKFND